MPSFYFDHKRSWVDWRFERIRTCQQYRTPTLGRSLSKRSKPTHSTHRYLLHPRFLSGECKNPCSYFLIFRLPGNYSKSRTNYKLDWSTPRFGWSIPVRTSRQRDIWETWDQLPWKTHRIFRFTRYRESNQHSRKMQPTRVQERYLHFLIQSDTFSEFHLCSFIRYWNISHQRFLHAFEWINREEQTIEYRYQT